MTGADSGAPVPPPRPQLVRSAHGARLDPYYWLRDDARDDPGVLAHLHAENAYRQRCMADAAVLERRLYEEIVARLRQDDASVPYLKSGYWYYRRYDTGKEHPIFARRAGSLDAPEQIMIDGNVRALGHAYYQLGALEVSLDGELLAFCEDTVGRRAYRLCFKNLRSGTVHATQIDNVETDLAWANDNRTVFYVAKDPQTLLGIYVKKHVLFTDPADDALVFEQTDKSFYTGVSKSKSERYVFISMESTVSSEWHYADADDPALEFQLFLGHERDHEYQIEHLHEHFVVRSNWGARNFRVAAAPVGAASNRADWRDLVPHRDDTFIQDVEVFDTFLAVSVRVGGLRKISIKVLPPDDDRPEFCIDSAEAAYATDLADNPELDTQIVRYTYSSLTTPTSIYDYHIRTGEKTLLKRDPVVGDFDPANYRTEFLFVEAADGKKVPVSIVYRSDCRRDGSAPLLIYAYGAYGLSVDPVFASSRLSLLDRGFVYAIAHVRGGQELGRDWYDSGRLLHKHNSFSDFIDVTRHLVAAGYGAPGKVCAMGGSAGGLLVAAVANLAPEWYRAIVAQVPFVDVVTTMLDESIPLTTNEYDEWGNPADRAYYDYLLSYSPYDNVRAQDYPAMLVTTGLWDSQVQYYEPVKWVAKLRALKTGRQPILMHIDMDAGHGGKSGRFQRYREIALEYAFLLNQLGIDV